MTPRSLAFALLDYFPYGGQQRDFLKIAQAALEHGHRVRALVHTWEGEVPDGIEVVKLAATGRSNHRKLQRFAAAVQEYRNRQPTTSSSASSSSRAWISISPPTPVT